MRLPPRFFPIILLVLTFGHPCLTLGGTIRHDKSDSSYRTLSASYASVGKLNWTDGGSSYLASGTLIAPNWVLTAGHCTDGQAVSAMNFSLNQTTYAAAEWFPHPNWNGDLDNGFDIGLVRLSNSIVDVTPASRLTSAIELGQVGVSVGFGTTGTGKTGYQAGTGGTKRAGENIIDAYGSKVGMPDHFLLSDFDDPSNKDRKNAFGSSTPRSLEYSIAPGDSGGGTFINVGGAPLLAGVHSFISAFYRPYGDGTVNASYSDFFGSTRVALFNDWIDSHVLGLSPSGVTTSTASLLIGSETLVAGSAVAVPESPSAFLAVLGLLSLVLSSPRGRREN
jgi:Trypsin